MKTMKKSIAILLAILMLLGAAPLAFAAELSWELDEATGALTITGEGKMKDFVNAPWKDQAAQILSVSVGDGITKIGKRAFTGCVNLTSVSLPETLTAIGEEAFAGCSSLAEISIPDTVTTFGNRAFDGCAAMQSFTFPAEVETVGSQLFRDCVLLANVALPEALTAISYGMFCGCTSLAEIEITEKVKSIGQNAFQNCTSLETIVLPIKVASVGAAAFNGCTSLTDIIVTNPDCRIKGGTETIPAGTVIHAVEGSDAEAFAQLNGLNFDRIEVDLSALEGETKVDIPKSFGGFFADGFLKKFIDRLRNFYLRLLKLFGLRHEKVVALLDEVQNPTTPAEEEV